MYPGTFGSVRSPSRLFLSRSRHIAMPSRGTSLVFELELYGESIDRGKSRIRLYVSFRSRTIGTHARRGKTSL